MPINDAGAIVGTATYTPPTLPPGQSPPANQPAAGQHGVLLAPIMLSCPIADTESFDPIKYSGIPPDINPTYFVDVNDPTPPDPTRSGSQQPALVIAYKDAINNSFVVQPFTINLNFAGLSGATWEQVEQPNASAPGTLQNASNANAQFVNPTEGGLYQFDGTIGTTTVRTSLILPLAGAEVKDIVASDIVAANTFAGKVLANYNPYEINLWVVNGIRWFNYQGSGDYLGRPDNQNSNTCTRLNPVSDDTGMGAVCTWFGVPVRVAKLSNFLVGYTCESMQVWKVDQYLANRLTGTSNDASAQASWDFGVAVADGTKNYSTDTVTFLQANFFQSDAKVTRLWPNSAAADNHTQQSPAPNFSTEFSSPGFLQMTNP